MAFLRRAESYPPLSHYGLIGDCHTAALISLEGAIDWCCLPRLDSPSVFGRLLDWQKGGYCRLSPADVEFETERHYLGDTLVLATTFRVPSGRVRVIDFFAMRDGGRYEPYRQLIRMAEGVDGEVDMELMVAPRFDYGAIVPWLRMRSEHVCHAMGGDQGLLVFSEVPLKRTAEATLEARFRLRAGTRRRFFLQFYRPELLFPKAPEIPDLEQLDRRLEDTLLWWHAWASEADTLVAAIPEVRRSAVFLKALTNAPTGAIAAAATTSLPEQIGGTRNWDYRFSWIRDSVFTVRCLNEIGYAREADRFRAFIQRSAAGSARDLQVLYGIGGERRLEERELPLDGYAHSRPVRVGNAASGQTQLDAYGELVLLTWYWYTRGHIPDHDFWQFLVELVDAAATRWREPDHGIWEIRGEPRHFVHSKAMCWVALDRGIALAQGTRHKAPVERWRREAEELLQAIESHGYDRERGVFTQSFDSLELDAALLLLPSMGFISYHDPRMVRTVEAIRQELMQDGFVLRYRTETGVDGFPEGEGVFLPCSFWLVECLAHQGRVQEAVELYERTVATANDLGIFSEEWDPKTGQMLGNLPQGLTHLSHIVAAMALLQAGAPGMVRLSPTTS